ncbi:hypothetical protein KKD61_01740 [Patescibacteria group bacterium]|nr:hypothetical protein [Patescibacteria group bacterium]
MKKLFKKVKNYLRIPLFFVLIAFPASTNYKLKSFTVSGGGEIGSTSPNYLMEGVVGELAGTGQTSSNYQSDSGLIFVQQANVPPAPTFTNGGSWYNRLNIIIDTGSNPTDATFAIAITDDNWTTTEWVQNDNTVGSNLGIEDFQTYTNWGGAAGENIIGLDANTIYKVKVKARQGLYTESPLGPEASASTSQLSLSFDIDVAGTDTETGAPYVVDFGSLTSGSVNTAANKVWIDLATNAEMGGLVFVYDANSGLKSTIVNYTISSATADLSGAPEGFGLRGDTASESSGGPMAISSPYNGAGDNVGLVDTIVREIFSSSQNPVTGGRASFLLKAKPSDIAPAATDYLDTLTLIAAASF